MSALPESLSAEAVPLGHVHAVRGGVVEVAADALAQLAGHSGQPVGTVLGGALLAAPVGILLVEERSQVDRLAKVHGYRAETLLERRDDLENIEEWSKGTLLPALD